METRSASAREGAARSGESGSELARDEGIERAKARGKLEEGQAALAIKPPEKIGGGHAALVGVAFEAAGDQVAVGIASQLGLRHDMVEAFDAGGEAAQAVKARTALAGMNGLTKSRVPEKICRFEIARRGQGRGDRRERARRVGGANLRRQADLDDVPGFAALDQTQSALVEKTTKRLTSGADGETNTLGEPGKREAQSELAFEASVTQKIGIDGAINCGPAQPWSQIIFKLLPDEFGIGFFDLFHFHVGCPEDSERRS